MKIPTLGVRLMILVALLSSATIAKSQDSHRVSLAGAAAAEQERRSQTPGYYNLELGPVRLRFEGRVGVEATDNVNYTPTNRISDVAFSPGVNVAMWWPLSPVNTLYFNIGAGYITWIKTRNQDHLYLTPGSVLAYRLYVGNWAIELHDRFSMTQDVTQNPTLSGTGNLTQLENVTGIGATWDLNKLVMSFGYDHDLVNFSGSGFEYASHNTELLSARASYVPNASNKIGLEVGGGFTHYDQVRLNDNTTLNVGPFYQAQLSKFLRLQASAGVVNYWFTPNVVTPNPQNLTSLYGDLALTHKVNRQLDYTLSAGHQFQYGLTANVVDVYSLHFLVNWNLFRHITLVPRFDYSQGKEKDSLSGPLETFSIYSGGVQLRYQLTRKLETGLEYALIVKNSNLADRDYVQNRLVLDLLYRF